MNPFAVKTSRRAGLALALAALAAPAITLAFPNPQVPFPSSKIPQFTQPLPLLSVTPGGTMTTVVTNTPATGPLHLSMCEVQAKVLPPGTFAPGVQPLTWVWAYIVGPCPAPGTPVDSYIGPVLVNTRGTPTSIRYSNRLPTVDRTNVLSYKYSTDATLHWADPLGGEINACHNAPNTNPPQMNLGIPAFGSECSLNFGENPRGVYNPVGIPAVPHLHGGEVPPGIDGGPDAWFTGLNVDGSNERGHDYYTDPRFAVSANEAVYSYPNAQQAAPLWFHDHTLGATRLNVYAGLAGAYYLLDPAQETYFQAIRMRPVTEVVPVVLQDRMFDTNGQLYFPTDFPGGINGPTPNPQHPYWNPEFVGDTVVINGKAWPFMNVQPRRYRFLFLNGSNARAYEMFLISQTTGTMGPGFWTIGTDDGFLDTPAYVDPNAAANNHLVMQPGERYEVIIDFSKFAGQTLIVKNVGKAPFPGGKAPQGTTTGMLMQFRVSAAPVPDTSYDPASGIALRPSPIVRLALNGAPVAGLKISKVRELTLNEAHLLSQTATDPVTGVPATVYPGGPTEILVNNTTWMGESTRPYKDFTPVTITGRGGTSTATITEMISETPNEGDVELWEIVNTTVDAHPIHTHLASFQIVNRQNFDTKAFMTAYGAGFTLNLPVGCTVGLPCPGYGPPYAYDPVNNTLSGGKWGGNPDVTPYLRNLVQPPAPQESGWKDVFIAYPGMVNRFLVRWGPQDTALNTVAGYPFSPNDSPTGAVADSHGYVWHCHIIDHEDNEMMRPDVVIPLPGAPRTFVQGVNY
jgi:FtsP/CotA-like multicopper oxidase with cupredoxin domain